MQIRFISVKPEGRGRRGACRPFHVNTAGTASTSAPASEGCYCAVTPTPRLTFVSNLNTYTLSRFFSRRLLSKRRDQSPDRFEAFDFTGNIRSVDSENYATNRVYEEEERSRSRPIITTGRIQRSQGAGITFDSLPGEATTRLYSRDYGDYQQTVSLSIIPMFKRVSRRPAL